MPSNYRNIQVPGCIDAPLRRALQDLNERAKDSADDVTEIYEDVINPLLTSHYDGTALSYFVNPPGAAGEGVGSSLIMRYLPPIRIALQGTANQAAFSDLGGGVYGGTAKLLVWNGSAYATTGSSFSVVDTLDKWHHAYTGDQGYLGYDEEREVLFPYDLNTASRRDVTISGTLARDASTTWTDADTSNTGTVYGRYITTDYIIPSGCRIGISWFPNANSGVGRWYADVIDKCLEYSP